MKFGKSLSNQIEETLPEWRDKFLSYKDLKKKLKSIHPKLAAERPAKRPRPDAGAPGDAMPMTQEETDFIRLLEDELEKFNNFFVENEEEYVIRMKILQDGILKAKASNEEMLKIRKEIVDFHGEMVLLENYSALNFIGLVKILKKYDKRTGALIRLPFIQRVLQQPFFTTDVIYRLVKGCEVMLDGLFPKRIIEGGGDLSSLSQTTTVDSANDARDGGPSSASSSSPKASSIPLRAPEELAEIEHMESLYMKSTVSALQTLKEIRSGSSTVSMFSLPPLQANGLEETWTKKIPILEQAAK